MTHRDLAVIVGILDSTETDERTIKRAKERVGLALRRLRQLRLLRREEVGKPYRDYSTPSVYHILFQLRDDQPIPCTGVGKEGDLDDSVLVRRRKTA